jgi:hypothetical protein
LTAGEGRGEVTAALSMEGPARGGGAGGRGVPRWWAVVASAAEAAAAVAATNWAAPMLTNAGAGSAP